jgi:hypothetical protein
LWQKTNTKMDAAKKEKEEEQMLTCSLGILLQLWLA